VGTKRGWKKNGNSNGTNIPHRKKREKKKVGPAYFCAAVRKKGSRKNKVLGKKWERGAGLGDIGARKEKKRD